MPKSLHQQIYDIAEQRFGYVTTAQAVTAEMRPNALVLMARRGVLERVSRGVYRLVSYPSGPLDEYMEAVLWPQGGTQGVISHASSLVFHGLSDVSPAKMHVTLPLSYRVRRSTPRHLVIHYDPLLPEDVTKVNGIPVTTPMRTIRDAIADHLSPALIRQAIADGRRRAGLRERDEAALRQQMEAAPDGTARQESPSSRVTPQPLPGADGAAPKPPCSVGELAKRVRAYAKAQGTTQRRTRDWVSYMVLAAAIERAGGGGTNTHFGLKGGVVAELRLRGRAHTTTELDTFYRGPAPEQVLREIDDILAEPYGHFTFARVDEPIEMTHVKALRMPIRVHFMGTDWGTISLDVSRGEPKDTGTEMVEAFDIHQAFGLAGPHDLLCISLDYDMAHKIHGATKPPPTEDAENGRVQDALDIMLFKPRFDKTDARRTLRTACEHVFAWRNTHAWPPAFHPPTSWIDAYKGLAIETGVAETDLEKAVGDIQSFIDTIAAA